MFAASGLPALRTSAIALTFAIACGEGSKECVKPYCPASVCTPPPFTLTVADELTGQPVSSAQATSVGQTCIAPSTGVVTCAVGPEQATYTAEISAPGYVTKTVQVVVSPGPYDPCGCPCPSWKPSDVALARSTP